MYVSSGNAIAILFPAFSLLQNLFKDCDPPTDIQKINYFKTEMLLRKVNLQISLFTAHCNENPNYVFLFWELSGLSVPISTFMFL